MKVKVRTIDGQLKVLEVSKAMLVQDFRKKVQEAVGIEPKKQRLLFRGKQLENGCDLLDYRIEIGTIIDVIERVVQEEVDTNSAKKGKDGKKEDDPPKYRRLHKPDGRESRGRLRPQLVIEAKHSFQGLEKSGMKPEHFIVEFTADDVT